MTRQYSSKVTARMTDLDSLDGYPEKVHGISGERYVYVLELFDGHYYVGMTKAPKRRIISHARSGANTTTPSWVQMYPPVGIKSVTGCAEGDARELENKTTVELATEHGPANVRGGSWTDVDDAPPTSPGTQ
jgi:predicted GIY-YIG superfamily endonuclease